MSGKADQVCQLVFAKCGS